MKVSFKTLGCRLNQHETDALVSAFDRAGYQIVDFKKQTDVSEVKIPSGVFNYQPVQKSFHTRAAIKIQDGCDNFCTFCIIPQVRGRAVSRPVDEVIENIKKTIGHGFKEVVLTGVNIGRYYSNGTRFTQLLEKVLEIPGDFRVRISSLEPDGFGKDFIALFLTK